jgi:hypothetical protein
VRIGLGAVFGLQSENLTTPKSPCAPRTTQSDNWTDLLANYSHMPTAPLCNHSLAAQAASIAHTFKQACIIPRNRRWAGRAGLPLPGCASAVLTANVL